MSSSPLDETDSLIEHAILVTTFSRRFDEAFRLIEQLRAEGVGAPIFVVVNGDYPAGGHDSGHRGPFLSRLATVPGVNPIFLGSGRGLSYVLNTGLRLCHARKVLVLADDVWIESGKAPELVDLSWRSLDEAGCLVFNMDMGHFAVRRDALISVGFFNEALPGIGWEDSDILWRFGLSDVRMLFVRSPSLQNQGLESGFEDVISEKVGSKYSLSSRVVMEHLLWDLKRVSRRQPPAYAEADASIVRAVRPRLQRGVSKTPYPFEAAVDEMATLGKSRDSAKILSVARAAIDRYRLLRSSGARRRLTYLMARRWGSRPR